MLGPGHRIRLLGGEFLRMLSPVLLDPVAQRSGLDTNGLRDLDDRSIRGQEELDGIILELLGVLLPTGGHDCECSLEPVSLNHTAAVGPVSLLLSKHAQVHDGSIPWRWDSARNRDE